MNKLAAIFVLTIISLVTFSTAQPEFPNAAYDGKAGTLTLNLKKGWNLIPWMGPAYGLSNTCGSSDYGAKALFIWSPTEKRYVGGKMEDIQSPDSETSRVMNRDENDKYYYAQEGVGALFILRDSDCSATARIHTSEEAAYIIQRVAEFKIPAGWNFITIHPWMLNMNIGDFMGTCEITKAFTFDPVNGWIGGSVSKSELETAFVSDEDIGRTYAMKFSTDCVFGLKESTIAPPPALPE